MQANEYDIIAAPIPINKTWWFSLRRRQRISLVLYLFMYLLGTIFNTVAMFIDNYYDYTIQLDKIKSGTTKPTQYKNKLQVKISKGFWREDFQEIVDNNLEDRRHTGYIQTNLQLAIDVWKKCQKRSIRGNPCHLAAIFCMMAGFLILYYHCTTVVLFRTFMILNVNLAAILLSVSMAMEYSAAVEYDYCITSVFTERGTNAKKYVRGRYYNRTLNISGHTYRLMLVGNIAFYIPMISLGVYLLFFNRTNL